MRNFLERVATRHIVAQALRESGYAQSQFVKTLMEKCAGVWIYLHYLVHEIAEKYRGPLNLDTLPFGLTQYYAQYWGRLRDTEEDNWYETYLPLLATLAIVPEAVPVQYLLKWADLKIPQQRIQRILRERWRPFLIITGEQSDPYCRLYHVTLREFLSAHVERDQLSTGTESLIDALTPPLRNAPTR